MSQDSSATTAAIRLQFTASRRWPRVEGKPRPADLERTVRAAMRCCASTLLPPMMLLIAGPSHATALRTNRADNPGQPCPIENWGPVTSDPFSAVDSNADFSPGITLPTASSTISIGAPAFCTPDFSTYPTLWGIWQADTTGHDPPNLASNPAVPTGGVNVLPQDLPLVASDGVIYNNWWSIDNSGPQPAYTYAAMLAIWTLNGNPVTGNNDYEFEFDGWCDGTVATASFNWMGNIYQANCSSFSGDDLLINQSTGLPDGYVIFTPGAFSTDGTSPTLSEVIPISTSLHPTAVADWQITYATSTTLSASGPFYSNASPNLKGLVETTDGAAYSGGGSVQLLNGTTVLGTVPLNTGGSASFGIAALPAGTYSLTATYLGVSGQAIGSSSQPVTVTVYPALPTISVSPSSIVLGQSATVTWSSSGASSCTASGGWTGGEPLSGSAVVTPTASGTQGYSLTCTANGLSSISTASLTVALPPPSVTVAVSPASITLGQTATLTWSSTNATSCAADSAWSGAEATSGTKQVTPTTAGGFAYSLTCLGTGGNGNGAAALVVAPAVQPPPAAPTVTVNVSPSTITIGQSATVTWSSTNTASCMADSAWSGSESTSGTLSVTPTSTGGYAYSLTCAGAGGTANGAAGLAVVAASSSSSVAASSSSSGGGGAIGMWEIVGLGAILASRRRHRAAAPAEPRESSWTQA